MTAYIPLCYNDGEQNKCFRQANEVNGQTYMSRGFVTAEAHMSAKLEENQPHTYLASPSADVLPSAAAVKMSAFCVKGL